MSSNKRKAIDSQLQRRVRPRRELSEELEDVAATSEISDNDGKEESSEDEDQSDQDSGSSDENESDSSPDSSDSDSDPEPAEAESISFGALAKAQATLNRPSTKKSSSKTRKADPDDTWTNSEALERKAGRRDDRDFSRSNKHAPTEQSSKKAVSRRREIIPSSKPQARDPRFEPLSGPVDATKIQKAYSFLDTYRTTEIAELKKAIKESKNAEATAKLKAVLLSMESQKKTQMRKEKEQEILDRHRKEEKELVKLGKKPFYLKKAEQRTRVLVEEYKGMKGKKLDHAIERRRKKMASKEKKNMPWERRNVGE